METIGIPRAITYYRYFPFLKTFLEELGKKVVVSCPTNKALLERGTWHCVDDICVPVKLYFGHTLEVAERSDRVLVPRMVSVEEAAEDTYTCPKLIGLPDMLRHSLDPCPPIVEFVVDIQNRSLKRTALDVGRALSCSPREARRGLRCALEVEAEFRMLLLSGLTPEDAMAGLWRTGRGPAREAQRKSRERERGHDRLTIGLLGHEYLIHDRYVSHDLGAKLERLGADVVYPTQIDSITIDRELSRIPGISWSYEKELLGAASHLMRRPDIDGVILTMCFACGPDSIVAEIISREIGRDSTTPFMTLVLDEHSGEAGVRTRLEAFVDMIRRAR